MTYNVLSEVLNPAISHNIVANFWRSSIFRCRLFAVVHGCPWFSAQREARAHCSWTASGVEFCGVHWVQLLWRHLNSSA